MNENNLDNIPIRITVEVGCVDVNLKDLKTFGEGSCITLNQAEGTKMLLKANGEPFALGEVVVIDDMYGIRIEDILTAEQKESYKYRKDIVPFGKIVKG